MKRASKWIPTGLLALSLVAGISGCASHRHYGEYRSDRTITREVNDALKSAPGYPYPNVSVRTYNGVVTMSGYVDSPQQKADAIAAAQRVPGVREIMDNISVRPLPTGRVPVVPAYPQTYPPPVYTPPQP